jgi:cold-inducible RNA-binding protein
MSAKLFVGNLPHETTAEELGNLFSEVCLVESCNVIVDRDTGRSKGFGFVETNSVQAADAAKQRFNGQEVNGHTLTVSHARPQNRRHNNRRSNDSSRACVNL